MAEKKQSARNKMMDYLAKRDHSEFELRKKLRQRSSFSAEEIDAAIKFGQENNWLPSTEKEQESLAKKYAGELHRRNKGIQYINGKLAERGLPEVQSDLSQELEKALDLVKNKYEVPANLTFEEKQKLHGKIGRFLISRGFTVTVVKKVIYEKF